MTPQVTYKLNAAKKVLLAAAATVTIVAPIATASFFAAPTRAIAQAPAGTTGQPVFDVASVKPDTSGNNRAMTRIQPGGLFTATNVTLESTITSAYQLKPHQLIAEQKWNRLLSERFDIEAKAEGNPSTEQTSLMLQSLLADRFKLIVHHETRQLPVFALVLSKAGQTGAQLLPHSDQAKCIDPSAPPPPVTSDMPPRCGNLLSMNIVPVSHISGNKVTMEMLADRLSYQMDRIVVDHTGLDGLFDLKLEYAPAVLANGAPAGPDVGAPDPSAPPTIVTALQEQLGLKLESQTAPVDVLVVDHIEEPSPN
jgi:uncharacterized protein (TIGR03435 family)